MFYTLKLISKFTANSHEPLPSDCLMLMVAARQCKAPPRPGGQCLSVCRHQSVLWSMYFVLARRQGRRKRTDKRNCDTWWHLLLFLCFSNGVQLYKTPTTRKYQNVLLFQRTWPLFLVMSQQINREFVSFLIALQSLLILLLKCWNLETMHIFLHCSEEWADVLSSVFRILVYSWLAHQSHTSQDLGTKIC